MLLLAAQSLIANAQTGIDAKTGVRIDASRITVGDEAHVFLEVQHNPSTSTIQWAQLPDTFSRLEITGKGPIDTTRSNGLVTYKQKLVVTGFDSGIFTIPSFQFTVLPKGGTPYVLSTDSMHLLVQTVAVDTTRPFRAIKTIIPVNETIAGKLKDLLLGRAAARDYIWVGIIFALIVALILGIIIKRRKPVVIATGPQESLQEKAQRLLNTIDKEQLWQKGEVKEYYVRLTDVLRGYIEARFDTAALELTTDELIEKARTIPELQQIATPLESILRTADLAKFAKAQPLPQEHVESMQLARELVVATTPSSSQSTNPTTTAA